MNFLSGQSRGRVILLHGGASTGQPKPEKLGAATRALGEFATSSIAHWETQSPIDVVVAALGAMEADPQFNAGRGGALQSDGVVRVTAGLMDGSSQRFSGVINVEGVQHPSKIARTLKSNGSRVISQPGVQSLAIQLNLPIESLLTESALEEWGRHKAESGHDTVGCVARTNDGRLAAGTSTGGRTMGFAGRVSDSATVAGNYASHFAAISTTGIGEEIVDDALAARIETRCRDGMNLEEACRRSFDEAVARQRSYGWIALHRDGSWVIAHTTPTMSYAVSDETGILADSSALATN